MHFHTGNLYRRDVPTVHISLFLTNKQIEIMKKQHPQLRLTFITSLDVVLLMVEFNWKTQICYMCKQESSSDEFRKKRKKHGSQQWNA